MSGLQHRKEERRLSGPSWHWPRILGVTGACLLLSPLVYVIALLLAEPLLTVRTGIQGPVDVLVVLGGDGPVRTAKAASLYRAGLAPWVLATGDGDCLDTARLLEEGGVPKSAIVIECMSGTTWENAAFSAPILAEKGVQRAILVTGWFHTRRALGCFRKNSPDIDWMTAPVERILPYWNLLLDLQGTRIAREHLKLLWYVTWYGIEIIPSGKRGE